MSVTKTPRAVVEGNPPSPTHQVVNAELRTLLDEMRVETAAAIAARNQLAAVACATTANITLSGEQTIDGVTTSASRVLVKNQTTTTNNGIYVSAAGAWARATDANTSEEVALAFVYVLGGTVAAGKTYQILNSPTLGTDAITWTLVGYEADLAALQASLGALAVQDTIIASQISDATAAGQAVLTAANAAAQRAALGLVIGTDVAGMADKLDATFATPEQVTQGLDEVLPVNSAGVYAAIADSERRMSDDLQTRLPAAMTDGVTSPGISPERYCVASEGAPGYLPPVAFPLVVGSSEKGRVLEWNGSGSLATDDEAAARLSPVGVMALASGRIWRVRAVYRRGTETADPSGDAVRVSIQWLGADFTTASLTTAETDIVVQTALSPSDGWQTITAVLAQADATGVDHFNTQAVYARVFIEQQGNSSYDDGALITVAELVQEDITFAEVVTDVAAGIDARVTVLENRDVYATTTLANGTDLHALTTPGDFTVMSAVNAPSMAGTTIGGTFRERNSTTAHALVWDYSASKEGLYWANKVSSTWGNWQEVASVEYVDGEIQSLANDIAAMATSYTARNSAYTVVAGDRGKVINATSGTWTLSLTAAATLGSGFSVIVANTGTGIITVDPDASELIDGASAFAMGPDRMVMLMCTGSAWIALADVGHLVRPSDFWSTGAGYYEVGSLYTPLGSVATQGANAVSLTSNGYRGAGSLWVSHGVSGTTGAAQITADPTGYVSLRAEAVKATGAPVTVTEIARAQNAQFLTVNGTAADPAYSLISDTNTGIYRISEGLIGFSSNGTLAARVDAAGTALAADTSIVTREKGDVRYAQIAATGSNANGEYVRFADGTQICTVTATAVETTTAVGSIYMHVNALTWTFPATFTGTPVVSGGAGNVSRWLGIGTPGTTSVAYRVYAHSTSATTSTPVMTATGRWF